MKTTRITRFSIVIAFGLSLAASPARAVTPAPDGDYPNQNTAEGHNALGNLDTGAIGPIGNTAVGATTLFQETTTGSFNTAVGDQALGANTADFNTAVGAFALDGNSSGTRNTAIGVQALLANTIGGFNTATGANALQTNTTGADNTAVGSSALANNKIGNDNTATGFEVLLSNTSGTANTASGLHAMQFNTTGSDNTASGLIALQSNTTGAENTGLGAFALATNSTGKNNTAEGSGALANSTTGSNNVAVGFDAGLNLKSGGNNIIIGANVPGTATDANTIRIGKAGIQQKTFIAGISGKTVASGVGVIINSTGQLGTVQSSAVFKDDIRPMDKASEALLKLKPVTFRYKKELDPERVPQFGLMAEEVEKVDPDLVVRDAEGKVYTVRYEAVNAMLLNEFLKEHQTVEEQAAAIVQLRSDVSQQKALNSEAQEQIKKLTAAVRMQTSQIQKVSAQLQLSKLAPKLVRDAD